LAEASSMLLCVRSLAFLWLGFFSSLQEPQTPPPAPPQAANSTPPFSEARHLSEIGKYDEAIAQLEALRNQTPPPAGLSHELGIAYYKKSDYANAILNFQKALTENPSDSEATQLVGICLYLAGRTSEAIPYLQKVLTWYPSANVDAAYILGVSYIQNKQYD